VIASMRRSAALAVTLLLALAGVTATVPSGHVGTTDTRPSVTAVVSVVGDAGRAALRGLRVLSVFPELGSAVVSGTPDQIAALRGQAGVRSVVPNYPLRPASASASADKNSVFASDRLGGGAGAPDAGRGVTVAVIDTGIADTPGLDRAPGRPHDGLNVSGESSFGDGFGHGTFMANLVAGGRAPGSGGRALGVAPGAKVVNVKVASRQGDTSLAQVLTGMSWVYNFRDRIDVVQFAFAGERPGEAYGPDPLTFAVEKLREGGLVVVVPSGNTTAKLGDPGYDPYVVTVGAADSRTARPEVAGFSGYGEVYGVSKPDVVATGVGLLSLLPRDSVLAQANPQSLQSSGLYRSSGTSQATAVTAGVAALFLEDFPHATPAEVKASLRTAAKKVKVTGVGAGQGLVQVPHKLHRANSAGSGTGEERLDVAAWNDNAWLDGVWLEDMATSWGAISWGATSWGATSWGATSWGATSWGATSWGATSWGATSWGATSWGATSWGAASWATADAWTQGG
jgi:serine protease AprX